MADPSNTIARLIAGASARLGHSGSTSPRLDAELLYRHVAGLDRTGLFLVMQDDADDDTMGRFELLVAQREAGEPVAYLTGQREFMGMPFHVAPGVLIPRPETELLVEWALERLERLERHRDDPITIVDVGAGSGAIGIAIAALAGTSHRILAVEPSPRARVIAGYNADNLLDRDRRVHYTPIDGDLLSACDKRFGMVLANLPYLTPKQIAGNPDLAAEPTLALDGGRDGLDLVRRLIGQLPDHLTPVYTVGLEIDPSQAVTVVDLLRDALPDAAVSVIQDLAGFDRHVVATHRGD